MFRLLTSLYGLHAASTAVGLLTLPLAAKALGLAAFGRASYGMAVAALLAPLVDLGLDLWLARKAAGSLSAQPQTYATVVAVRGAIWLAAAAALVLVLSYSSRAHHHTAVVLLYLTTLAPSVLGLPALVQARADYRAEASWLLASRLSYAAGVVLVLPTIPTAEGLALLAASASAIYWLPLACRLWRAHGLRPSWPSAHVARALLTEAWPLTVLRGLSVSYASTPVLLLGYLHGATAAGAYALAERFLRSAQQMLTPLSQLGLSAGLGVARVPDRRALARVQMQSGVLLSALLAALAIVVLPQAFADFGQDARIALLILAPVAGLAAASNVWGINSLGAAGRYRALLASIALAAVSYWLLAIASAQRFGAAGMAAAVLAAEFVAACATFTFLLRAQPRTSCS